MLRPLRLFWVPFLAICGCSLFGGASDPDRIGPPITFFSPDSGAFVGPPDSVFRSARPAPVEPPPPPPRRDPPPKRRTPSPPVAESEPDTIAALPDSTPMSPPISIDLPDERRVELWRSTLRDLATATSLLDRIPDPPRTDQEAVKVQTLRGLVTQARTALDRKDLTAAASLAHKARLLAEQLASP
ncbi:MAG: hypothetical protein GF346_06635 [Candidatus Eisenbacteria bacterium]|nr:hypothetical protein [Candidatus Eisenbacteria bacterium]